MPPIATNYLVIGAGAMGMAFTDVVLTETDATITIVDRRDRVGGHWNDAYPFVRLHQPSAFYGVNSVELSSGQTDDRGWNEGLAELASGVEVLAYLERVMHDRFLPSGRVRYLSMHEYRDGQATSTVTGATTDIEVGTRTVDCTYMNVQVPSVNPPAYDVDPDAVCIPPNQLPHSPPTSQYVIVGSGKTGIDSALWLLDHGIEAGYITWIRPRDAWMLDRANIQPTSPESRRSLVTQFEASAAASSAVELFERLEADGNLLRLDTEVAPTMYRCATVTTKEIDALRAIEDVVRAGHVKQVQAGRIVLDDGEIPAADTTVVDCTSDGLARRPAVDVFDGHTITGQAVRTCQQVFSAAFIGHVECSYDDEAKKNELCRPVPHPDDDIDWLRTTLGQLTNQITWTGDTELMDWLDNARLNPFSAAVVSGDRRANAELMRNALGAFENLPRLIASAE